MNILVTGGAGYIGSHTAVELLNAGHKVVIADNLYNAHYTAVSNIAKITGKTPAFYQINCACKNQLRHVFTEQKIDAVIHFAAYKAVWKGQFCAYIHALCLFKNLAEKGMIVL